MARPTSCTPDITAKVCRAIRLGASVRAACKYAKIPESTFYFWMGLGESDAPERAPYAAFLEAVEEAQSEVYLRLSSTVMRRAFKNSKLALEVLSRIHPEDWGRDRSPDAPKSGLTITLRWPDQPEATDADRPAAAASAAARGEDPPG